MSDTIQTRSQLVTALADNGIGAITAQVLRNLLISIPLSTDLAVTSVTAANGLSVTSGTLSFSGSSYSPVAGSSSLTTVGTVGAGTWNASIIGSTYGGTGVNNGVKTITLGGNLVTSGAFSTTFTVTANTTVTLPTSGTLATVGQSVEVKGMSITGSTVIVTGVTGTVQIPFNATITGWTVLSIDGISGSITFNVQSCAFANYPSTSLTDLSSGGNAPVLSSAITARATPASWSSVTVNAGDYLVFTVTGTPASVMNVRLEIQLTPR